MLFYSLYLYVKGFAEFRMGYASAMASDLFLITMACTIILIRTSKRWVHYQGGSDSHHTSPVPPRLDRRRPSSRARSRPRSAGGGSC